MRQSPAAWRWAALLGFALITPVALPAGGADRRSPEVRRRNMGDPLLSTGAMALRLAPEQQAPALQDLSADQPLRVLRSWRGGSGQRWLQVQAGDRRGWLAAG
ncbi:SH3 domain-containing protein [Cyanobium sp. Aljojuca 7D2]|uniref:SH3 domain-containing protein n=1 Tax=Cyanobium sp. Aljojuca 7D2 TaxID=2823698 RepID=UPI0020CCB067|nr:SH3 domain-containing protein [Cyanobium sp. Aljojuca 7D2]MCP9891952.1 SH3 domain-containing protein [Cyanobium sp. Aljojuca 7D2]